MHASPCLLAPKSQANLSFQTPKKVGKNPDPQNLSGGLPMYSDSDLTFKNKYAPKKPLAERFCQPEVSPLVRGFGRFESTGTESGFALQE
jgi:hypothetical protein